MQTYCWKYQMQVKLKKKVKDRWVKALRSGKYTQGQEKLRDKDDNFCCLGVLCDLHAKAHELPEKKKPIKNWYYSYGGQSEFPPKSVWEWAVKAGHPNVNETGELTKNCYNVCDTLEGKLSKFNDSGKSFNWIASYIERYL